jgi:hypothetical protein
MAINNSGKIVDGWEMARQIGAQDGFKVEGGILTDLGLTGALGLKFVVTLDVNNAGAIAGTGYANDGRRICFHISATGAIRLVDTLSSRDDIEFGVIVIVTDADEVIYAKSRYAEAIQVWRDGDITSIALPNSGLLSSPRLVWVANRSGSVFRKVGRGNLDAQEFYLGNIDGSGFRQLDASVFPPAFEPYSMGDGGHVLGRNLVNGQAVLMSPA